MKPRLLPPLNVISRNNKQAVVFSSAAVFFKNDDDENNTSLSSSKHSTHAHQGYYKEKLKLCYPLMHLILMKLFLLLHL